VRLGMSVMVYVVDEWDDEGETETVESTDQGRS